MKRPPRIKFPPAVRRAILKQDPTCRKCGVNQSTDADHIVPVAEGGPNTLANGQGLCRNCHNEKTRREMQRGLARWHERKEKQNRKPEPHPGFRD